MLWVESFRQVLMRSLPLISVLLQVPVHDSDSVTLSDRELVGQGYFATEDILGDASW